MRGCEMKFYEYKYQCDDCGNKNFSSSKIPNDAEKICFDCYQQLLKRMKDEYWTMDRIKEFEAKHTIYLI